MSLGAHYQQEVDLVSLFKDVSEFVEVCMAPAQARHLIDRAMKTALTARGVATIIVPEDVQESPAEPAPPKEHGAVFSSVGWARPRILPDEDELGTPRPPPTATTGDRARRTWAPWPRPATAFTCRSAR